MNKTLRVVLIWGLVLSPVWVGMIVVKFRPQEQANLGAMLRQVVGVAAIGIIGVIVSALARKKDNADVLSVVGYAVPAAAVCAYEIFALLN